MGAMFLLLTLLGSSLNLAAPPEPAVKNPGPNAQPSPARPGPRGRGPAAREANLKMSATTDRTAAVPGETLLIGVRLEIREGWHTYWPGDNDTGSSTIITLKAPPGYEVGPMRWPAPKRYIGGGDLLDYIYDGTVLLVIPVKVPADAKPGSEATFSLAGEWLVCKEACIPGSGTAELRLSVSERSEPTSNAAIFAESAARTPRPFTDQAGQPGAGTTLEWTSRGVRFGAAAAKEMIFYVGESSAKPISPITSCVSEGERLELQLEPPHPKRERLVGVLELRFAGRSPEFHAIDLPRPKTP
jgi:DsbC/DsbD-like thiol-disulfide interchange protein